MEVNLGSPTSTKITKVKNQKIDAEGNEAPKAAKKLVKIKHT